MSSVVLRLKRKACNEPAEGLMIGLKKSKFEDRNEVFFKLAATLKNETDSVKDKLQAAFLEDKSVKHRDPKSAAISQKSIQNISDRLKRESKAASEKKRLDLLNARRLILAETLPIDEPIVDDDDLNAENPGTEVRKFFQLYDIIEESEDVKKQVEEPACVITCNGEPLVREKSSDYVYDVYISDEKIDDSFFVQHPVCVRPCTLTNDDLYSSEGESSNEDYDDEDDSNDENNWRNEYPEDESSSQKDSDEESDEYRAYDIEHHDIKGIDNHFRRMRVASDDAEDSAPEDDYQ